MQWEYTPYVWLYVVPATVMGLLFVFLWQRRTAAGVPALLVLCVAVIVYTLGNAMQIGSTTIESAIFWSQVQYVGLVAIPVAWFVFAAQHGGQNVRFQRRHLALLAVIPAITLLLVWSNALRGLVWQNVRLASAVGYSVLLRDYGQWFWINVLYSYVLITMGAAFLVQAAVHSPRLYRVQALSLIAGAMAPVLANVVYISDSMQLRLELDLSGPAFAVSGLIIAWAIFRFRLFDIVPAARDTVIENMSDGVLVLDRRSRIVDINPAAAAIVGRSTSEVIGQSISDVLPKYGDLVESSRDASEAHVAVAERAGGPDRHFEMRISPLKDQRGLLTGRLVLLRDITERRETERKLAYLSTHDALTGVYNRLYFEAEMERLQPSRRFPVTIVVADVNGLKDVNDSLGHAVGDDLLRRAAVVLRGAFRAEDLIARIGGDEFVVLLPDSGEQAAESAVQRVKTCLGVHNAEHGELRLSMAVGAATAEVGDELAEALKRADRRMYDDKDAGVS